MERAYFRNASSAMTWNVTCRYVRGNSCWCIARPTGKAIGSITPTPDSAASVRCGCRCTRSRNMVKVVTRHVWQAARDRVDAHRLEPRGKKIYERRKET